MKPARDEASSSYCPTSAGTDVPTTIVVEVYSPQPRPQELAVLIAACSKAAAPVECVAADARGTEPPLGVAIVRRDGDKARIELGLRGVASAEWTLRDLTFQSDDAELERYRAIGFAVGTLVAGKRAPVAEAPLEVDRVVAPAPAPAPVPAPARTARAPRVAVPAVPALPARRHARATWLDASAGLALGLVPGPPRAGAALRVGSEFVGGGPFGVVETGYAERLGESSLRVRWLSLALGVGHPLVRFRSSGVDIRLQGALERFSLTAVDGGRSEAAARWKPGLATGLDAYWNTLPALGFLFTAAAHLDPARSVVRVAGTQVGETPALGVGAFIGLRLKLR